MSWRTVVVSSRAKLDLKLNCLVIRKEDETVKIHIGEISVLVIESTSISITSSLLNELIKQKVKIIFCDEKRNPSSELCSYYGCHDTSAKIRQQIHWKKDTMDSVWTEIVSEKIRNQRDLLRNIGNDEYKMLDEYLEQIEFRDVTNREGHAAKVYFNSLFGKGFSRSSDIPINAALNYGYSLILSVVNREIVSNGYITQLGLFHDNIFNQFNLGSDLMEPFRPIIDYKVYLMNPLEFEQDEKMELIDILNYEVIIEGKHHYLSNAIKIYCKSIFEALNEDDISNIKFYKNELQIYENNSVF